MGGERMTLPETPQLHQDMLTNCRFCVVCGQELEIVGRRQRGCPDDHGLLQISDNADGLPGAFFEFDDRLYQQSTS